MAQDVFMPNGAPRASKPESGNANIRTVPVLAVVKDNIDPIRSGRLRVYIADFSGKNSDNADSWITVRYMSPFYGRTNATAPNTGWGTYTQNPSSYGMWNSPPDIGSTVICMFINGDMDYGYYIGCVPEAEALQMVPAIGASDNVILNEAEAASYGGAVRLPVTNINTNNDKLKGSSNFLNEAKPVHSYAAAILARQGLIRDPIRGVIGSTAQRESPSRVGWGVNTPGRPIYAGGFTDASLPDNLTKENATKLAIIARRAGHSIVMDDGDLIGQDQLVRIRSAMGHQILMSDDGQCLFIIHSNGQSWIELGKEGTIDLYASNSVNIRTQGDLNLHADRNININAVKALNISAETIAIGSDKTTEQRVGGDFTFSTDGSYAVKVASGMSLMAAGEASIASDSAAYVNGSVVNLNTGAASLVPADVKPIPVQAHTDTKYDATVGYAAAPGALLSIVSRAPAHSPWTNAGQGVDVTITNDSAASSPAAPSAAVATTNADVAPMVTETATQAVVSTVPSTAAVSYAIPAQETAALAGQMATNAAASAAGEAIKNGAGAGVIDTATGITAVVGTMAQTPGQLEAAGVIKPGAAGLVNALTQQGKSAAEALTPNLFTGAAGNNLSAYVADTKSQVSTAVNTLQQAQAGLTNAGIITGKETATQVGGLVLAASSAGVASVANFVASKSSSLASVTGALGSIPSPGNAIAALVSGGNSAVSAAASVTSGLGSLVDTVKKSASGLLASAKGLASSAFSSITSAFKPFTAGIPQNLTAIATSAAAATTAASNSTPNSLISNVTGALGKAGSALLSPLSGLASGIGGTISKVTGLLPSAVTGGGLLSSITQAVSNGASTVGGLVDKAKLATSGVASGVNALPGGLSAIASVVDNAPGAVNAIPGIGAASTAIAGLTSAVTNGVNAVSALGGASASGLLGNVTGAAGNLMGSLSTGLSASASAQLGASISALSSGGLSVKLPTVATNTYDTSALESKASALLGDSKIPPATYGSVSDSAKAKVQTTKDKIQAQEAEYTKMSEAAAQYRINTVQPAAIAADNARNNLPAGDPEIERTKNTYLDVFKIQKEMLAAASAFNKTIGTY
jgi:hypothetical protein